MSNTTDMDYCLNCTLPAKFCVGEPKKCRKKYERYLVKLNASSERLKNKVRRKNKSVQEVKNV